MSKLEALTRRVVGNRRRHPRRRQSYDTIVRDEHYQEIFHGRTLDISKSGAKLSGFPDGNGVRRGQQIRVEFLVVPKDMAKVAQRVPVSAQIIRVEEKEDDFILAVRFDRMLPT